MYPGSFGYNDAIAVMTSLEKTKNSWPSRLSKWGRQALSLTPRMPIRIQQRQLPSTLKKQDRCFGSGLRLGVLNTLDEGGERAAVFAGGEL